MTSENQRHTLREMLAVPFRHVGAVVIFFFVVVGLVVVHVARTPDTYRSDAKMLVVGDKESTVSMLTGLPNDAAVSSEVELLESRTLAELTVERVGVETILATTPPDNPIAEIWRSVIPEREAEPLPIEEAREAAIETFVDGFGVEPKALAGVIDLSYEAASPELARAVLSDAIEVYVALHVDLHTGGMSLGMLTAEIDSILRERESAEQELRALEARIGVVDFDHERRLQLSRVFELESGIASVEAEIDAIGAVLARTRGLVDARERYSTETLNLEAARARLRTLTVQLRGARARLDELATSALERERIEQRVAELDQRYASYASSRDQARLAGTLASEPMPNVALMQSPTLLPEPVGIGTTTMLAAALLLGAIGGIALAFLLDLLDATVRSTKEVERILELRCLGSLGVTRRSLPVTGRNHANGSSESDSRGQFATVSEWIRREPAWRASIESVRDHVTAAARNVSHRPFVLAVTSSLPGEGVSSVAAGLAIIRAGIDRRPSLVAVIRPEEDGHDHGEIGEQRPAMFYSVIPRPNGNSRPGTRSRATGAVVRARRTKEEISSIDALLPALHRSEHDLVILDLPPLEQGFVSATAASLADGVILVVEAERSHRQVIARNRDRLTRLQATTLGVVLNKRRNYVPGWLYRRV